MKQNFAAYTKKELIAMIQRDMKDGDVAILTTGIKEMETKPKLKLSFLKFMYPHEMLKEPEDIRGLVIGNMVTSIILMRNPKQTVSTMYLEGLKKNDGVFGFSVGN